MKRWHFIVVLLAVSLGFFGLQKQRVELRNPANLDNVPILGFFSQGAKSLMGDIYGFGNRALVDSRDTAVFLVGGVALDVYIRTQIPLSKDVEKRILSRLHNYEYSSRLTYFLMGLKDRYTVSENVKNFETYIKEKYKSDEEVGLIHSLFSWKEVKEKENEDAGLDMKLVSKLVTLYDAIFAGELSFIEEEKAKGKFETVTRAGRRVRVFKRAKTKPIPLPEKYTRLGKSKEDQAVLQTVLPMVVELLGEFAGGMDAGDMKDMVNHIIADGAPDQLSKANNKAVAATASLVDFVRMTVLKNYRIYVKRSKRIESHTKWMMELLDDEYSSDSDGKLISYLNYASKNKKFGVQFVVDGLQGNLMEALALNKKDYLKKLVDMEQNKSNFKPEGLSLGSPEHVVQYDFLKKLAKNNFYSDERYLPFFKELYSKNINTVFKNGISTTPTISVRNLPIAKTGAEVAGDGGTSIPNFHFVDRKQDRAYYFFGNDALLLDELADEKGMKSMFDRLGSYKTLNCNAQYDWSADYSYEPLINLGLGESKRDFGEILCFKI